MMAESDDGSLGNPFLPYYQPVLRHPTRPSTLSPSILTVEIGFLSKFRRGEQLSLKSPVSAEESSLLLGHFWVSA